MVHKQCIRLRIRATLLFVCFLTTDAHVDHNAGILNLSSSSHEEVIEMPETQGTTPPQNPSILQILIDLPATKPSAYPAAPRVSPAPP
jgi:hypothetical protein